MAHKLTTEDGSVLAVGQYVAIHPAHDMWIRGVKYGVVVAVGRKYAKVAYDLPAPGVFLFHPHNLIVERSAE